MRGGVVSVEAYGSSDDGKVYNSREMFWWLEPLLTDEEYAFSSGMNGEADWCASFIPTGDAWA